MREGENFQENCKVFRHILSSYFFMVKFSNWLTRESAHSSYDKRPAFWHWCCLPYVGLEIATRKAGLATLVRLELELELATRTFIAELAVAEILTGIFPTCCRSQLFLFNRSTLCPAFTSLRSPGWTELDSPSDERHEHQVRNERQTMRWRCWTNLWQPEVNRSLLSSFPVSCWAWGNVS